jgi:oligopeptidase A
MPLQRPRCLEMPVTPTNPLLDFSGLPRFDAIQPEHIAPAIDALLAEAEAAVTTAETVTPAWATSIT